MAKLKIEVRVTQRSTVHHPRGLSAESPSLQSSQNGVAHCDVAEALVTVSLSANESCSQLPTLSLELMIFQVIYLAVRVSADYLLSCELFLGFFDTFISSRAYSQRTLT